MIVHGSECKHGPQMQTWVTNTKVKTDLKHKSNSIDENRGKKGKWVSKLRIQSD